MPDASLCISAKCPSGFLITTSSLKPASISDDDLVEVREIENSQLKSASGLKEPSPDAILHDSLYKNRGDINAIIHIHSLKLSDDQASHLRIPLSDNTQVAEKLGPHGEVLLIGNGLLIARDSIESAMDQFLNIYHRKKHLR